VSNWRRGWMRFSSDVRSGVRIAQRRNVEA
jgi:hypothetical protein